MKAIYFIISILLIVSSNVMGQENHDKQISQSIINNSQQLRVALEKYMNGENLQDCQQSVDSLTYFLYKNPLKAPKIYDAFGKIGLYGYLIAQEKTDSIDYNEMYRTIMATRTIQVCHDVAYYVCCQELLSYCTQRKLFKSASGACRCLLEFMRTKVGEQAEPYIKTLKDLSTFLSLNSQYKEADSCAVICQAFMESKQSTASEDYIDLLSNRIEYNQSLGNIPLALNISNKILASISPQDQSYLEVLLKKAILQYANNEYKGMSNTINNALTILESGREHNRVLEMQFFPLFAYVDQDSYSKRMLAYAERNYTPKDFLSTVILAKSYITAGMPAKATNYVKAAEKIMDSYIADNDTTKIEEGMPLIESLYLSTCQYDKLIEYWEKEIARCLKLGKAGHDLAINYTKSIADICSMQGQNAKANKYLDDLLNKLSLTDTQQKDILYSKAQNEIAIGNYLSAFNIGKKLLGMTDNEQEEYNIRLSITTGALLSELDLRKNNFQDLTQNKGNKELMDKLKLENKRLLALADKLYDREHINNINAHLLSLSQFYFENKMDSLLLASKESELYIQKLENSKLRNNLLKSLAADYFLAKDYHKALQLISIEEQDADIQTAWFDYSLKAESNLKTQKIKEAQKNYIKFSETIINNTKDRFMTMPENMRNSYWRIYRQWIYDAGKYMDNKRANKKFSKALYNLALFSKGLLLNSKLEIDRIIKNQPNEDIKEQYSQMTAVRNKIENDLTLSSSEKQNLNKLADNLEFKILTNCQQFGNISKYLSTNWKDIQKKLTHKEAAIEFICYNSEDSIMHYAALLIKKNKRAPIFVPLFSQNQISSDISSKSLNSETSKLIWEPICRYLKGITTVYFSPTGILNKLPIESLTINEDKTHFDIYRLSSTRQLLSSNTNSIINKAVLYGGLEYDASIREIGNTRGTKFFKFPYLEGTEQEANELSTLLSQNNIQYSKYMEEEGTETSFKQLSGKDFQLLHIGTHGFYRPMESSYLDAIPSLHIGNIAKIEDRSLYYSALAMAGINYSHISQDLADKDDGYLSSKEISLLDLSHVKLATLSACQTNDGDITGEGIFGLQRGFKLAGVESLLMTAWKISDDATALFMKYFYQHLLKGERKQIALQKAKEELRVYNKGQFADPFYWAGFILLDALD